MLNEKEVMLSACGISEEGESKAYIKVTNAILDVTKNKQEVVDDIILDGPVVNIFRNFKFTMVDLTFSSGTDYEFINLSDTLKELSKPEKSLGEDEDLIPALIVTVAPKELDYEYYLTGVHASWCLTVSDTGMDTVDTVRFIFTNDMIHVYHMDTSEMVTEEDYFNEETSQDV